MIVPKVGRKERRLASAEAIIATETATASATYIIVSQQSHKVFLAYGQEQMVLFKL